MFLRSVVGKLWLTIIGLVFVVLIVLTFLLLEFFQSFHLSSTEEQLTKLADKVAVVMETYEERGMALSTAWEIVDASAARFVIIASKDEYWFSPNPNQLPDLPITIFLSDEQLSKVHKNGEKIVLEREFSVAQNGQEDFDEMIIVGVPVSLVPNKTGGVYLYQSLGVVQNTMTQVQTIIYISAGIGAFLTTIFAFFLSTRITAPLRKMKEAAKNAAQGKYNTTVPIVSSDEIGELASAFNSMVKEINNNISTMNQEKEQLASILRSMADGVITFDHAGDILVTNPPAERFLQSWYYEQGMNQSEDSGIPKDLTNLFQRVVTLEKEQYTEITMQGRSWVILMTPLYNQAFIRGAVAVLRDMTEERRLDKLREDFIANVSHELRTPISLLQGYSEAIIDNVAGSEEENRELATIIYDESLRMGRLVNDLLDLARMETGHLQLNFERVEIVSFIERITRKFQELAKQQAVHLSFKKMQEEIRMHIDVDRIEQVLTNLIDNAIRHTEEGGTVDVSVEILNTGIKCDVTDSGSGIPEEDLPFVFERFYKADKARTRSKAGTGLGLAIAKNIIEAHHGQIFVHSVIDLGTTFSFYLPFKKLENHE